MRLNRSFLPVFKGLPYSSRRPESLQYLQLAIRLQEWMDEPSSVALMTEQDRQISEVIAEQRSRLRNFIRKRVRNDADAEDHLAGSLLRTGGSQSPADADRARDRLAFSRCAQSHHGSFPQEEAGDLQRRGGRGRSGELLQIEDLLPSPDAGPEALYVRHVLLEELEFALAELPDEQREVFVAHELEGRSFKELSAESGVSVNTLLSRKRYAVLHLRERLQNIYDEFTKK